MRKIRIITQPVIIVIGGLGVVALLTPNKDLLKMLKELSVYISAGRYQLCTSLISASRRHTAIYIIVGNIDYNHSNRDAIGPTI